MPADTVMVLKLERAVLEISALAPKVIAFEAALRTLGSSADVSGSVVAAFSVNVTFAKLSDDKSPPDVTAAIPLEFSAILLPALLKEVA